MNKFWNFFDTPNEKGSCDRELRLEGTISESTWFEDEVTPKAFRDDLNAGSGPLTVWINSPGGDCIAASQIYTMLREYKDDVTVKIDGIAASAASVIAMAGDTVEMSPTSVMMIHNPLTCAFGNREDMRQAIKMLDEIKESIVNAYELKTGLCRQKLSNLMDNETWMNARKALELGFCDAIIGENTETGESYSFSQNLVAKNLADKILNVNHESEDEPTDRVDITSLYDRLNRIKY